MLENGIIKSKGAESFLNIAICDDNETDIKYIGKIIKKEFAAHNINCELSLHTDAKSLLDVNQSQPFDVIFLDLDMPRLNGMDAASQLNKSNSAAEIIFVTNHDELVYKAYKFKALGFIRKKYLETEIEEILETLIETINSRQQYITFSDSGNEFKCLINDIMYMQSDDHYIDVITPKKKYTLRDSLNNIENLYAHLGFIRVHSRYLVNFRYIYSIEKNTIVLNNKYQLPISRSKIAAVKEAFQFYSRRI